MQNRRLILSGAKERVVRSRGPDRRSQVWTRLGYLPRRGMNEWGKALVMCPQCGNLATAGWTGEVWCKECGYSNAALAGCG
jgi:hypothetical protein